MPKSGYTTVLLTPEQKQSLFERTGELYDKLQLRSGGSLAGLIKGRLIPSTDEKAKKPLTAKSVDKYDLYQKTVQSADYDVRWLSRRFRALTGRPLRLFREDFCGSAKLCCEFVKLHKDNRAIGLDIDPECLEWCKQNNFADLTEDQRNRVTLLQSNVLSIKGPKVDLIGSFNFSHLIFRTRNEFLAYLKNSQQCLLKDGVMIMDIYGGGGVQLEEGEERQKDGYKYIWELTRFDPILNRLFCRIHFEFPDGSRLRNAFRYEFRLWAIPDLRDLLIEAGFRKVDVLWEGWDHKTWKGNAVFRRSTSGETSRAWIAYLVAQQ